nr:reverse transcriptase domain-containing protein [Tanacetum cinerariifolium]
MTKVIKEEVKKLESFEIDEDLFTYDTQLGMIFNEFNLLGGIDDDLFTYEIEIPKPNSCVEQRISDPTHNYPREYEWKMSYKECDKIYAEAVIFINKRLIRLIDVTVEQWLDLKYRDHKTTDKDVKKAVIDDSTQEIVDAGGIFLYKTPNEAFKILEDKVLLKLDFSDNSQISPKPKIVVFASGSNLNSDHPILMEKFKALAIKIDKERVQGDARRSTDNHTSQIYMKDDTLMYEPHENHQAIIKNLKRQFKYLEKKQPVESFPRTINSKPRHEFVYKPSSIQNENDKGDIKYIEEDEIEPILTTPSPKPINSNSPTVTPFLKDCTMHIPYTNTKTFTDDVLPNHVGDKELKTFDGVGTTRMTKKEVKKDNKGMLKEPNKE